MNSVIRIFSILFLSLIAISSFGQSAGPKPLKGMVINHSIKFKKGEYLLKSQDSVTDGVITIEGHDLVIDFNGAIIKGSADEEQPEKFSGAGIVIKGGKNIVIKNAFIRGFKVGLFAKGVTNLQIENCDFSYNFRQKLYSNRKREDLSDWQSYHHNEKDEWLRFGAGIYLRDCDSSVIHDNIVGDGQCGLMMTNCMAGLVYNNNFSFNSGIGIGMYHSSNNRIMYNKVDWNVRGFSFGVYYRGQDSGGILVYDRSSNNIFAYNSVTHSGDGFFLWAGQTTLDTGGEGCNDNLIYGNDFSYAPTNGVEITFSRNKVIKNIMHDCWHGIWAGFSYNTVIANNDFANNLSGIAIEHGHNNIIDQNSFNGDKVGIEIWQIPNRPIEMGFMKYRDTKSANYNIWNNSFTNLKTVFNIKHTDNVVISKNRIAGSGSEPKIDTTVSNLHYIDNGNDVSPVIDDTYIPKLPQDIKGKNAMIPEGHPKGKKFIMMTEYGPYNFKYPIAWLTKTDSAGKMHFDIMGPAGNWKIRKLKGVSNPSHGSGKIGDEMVVDIKQEGIKDIDIEFEYTGKEIVSPFGKKYAAGKPYVFHFREFEIPTEWKMRWYAFDSTSDPVRNQTKFAQLINGAPLKTSDGKELDQVFGRNFGKNIPTEKIATVSETQVDVPAGSYIIGISASEIVRLYVDGKLVIDSWDPATKVYDSDYHKDAVIKLGGKHSIRIEQAQYGGYGMLMFSLNQGFDLGFKDD